MIRVIGSVPLFVDCDPYAKTVSWSKTCADGKLAGQIIALPVDQAELFASDLTCCVNDVGAGEDHPRMSIPGPVLLYLEADAEVGSISFSALVEHEVLAGDITILDAIQADRFASLVRRGVSVCRTGVGDLNPHPGY